MVGTHVPTEEIPEEIILRIFTTNCDTHGNSPSTPGAEAPCWPARTHTLSSPPNTWRALSLPTYTEKIWQPLVAVQSYHFTWDPTTVGAYGVTRLAKLNSRLAQLYHLSESATLADTK